MYKLTRRKNLTPFLVLLGIGLAASVGVPPHFPDSVFEIPAFALFPAEIALVMMLSVLFFENATPAELLRLSFTMLAMGMLSGALCNLTAKTSQTLPDQTLLLNWVQLLCMNLTGLIGTIALYQTRAPREDAKSSAIREVAPKVEVAPEEAAARQELVDKLDAAGGESAKDILDKLDISRINRLEKQLTQSANKGNVNLESLFADESQAAGPTEAVAESRGGGLDSLLGGPEPTAVPKASELPAPPAETKPADSKAEIAASIDDLFGDITTGAKTESKPAETAKAPEPAKAEPVKMPEAPKLPETADAGWAEGPVEVRPDAKAGGGLFDDTSLGGDLEDIFAGLASDASKDEFSPDKLNEIKAAKGTDTPAAATAAPVESKPDSGLFTESLGGDLDDIFSDLAPAAAPAVTEAAKPAEAPKPAETPAPTPTPAPVAEAKPVDTSPAAASGKEVKGFGRLSGSATAKTEPVAPGTLKTIGQMLLDTQAVENIIKRTENRADQPTKTTAATARVVSVSRGADIQAMLDKISTYPGVSGSLVIGKDGLLIGSTESLGMMRDVYGVLALGIHSTTNLGTKKIDLGELRQSVLRTGQKLSVLTEIGIGVLATFADNYDLDKLDGMLDHIAKVVTDSQASGGAALPMETLSGGLLSEQVPAPPTPPAATPQPAAAVPPPAEPAPQPAPVAEAPGEEAVISIADAKGGLLSVNDDDIGGLFDNIVADPTSHHDDIAKDLENAIEAAAAPPAAEAAPLMSVDDDMMSDIFDNLMDKVDSSIEAAMDFSPPDGTGTATKEKPAEPAATESKPAEAAPAAETKPAEAPVAEKPPEAPAKPAEPAAPKAAPPSGQQIKEFGRLSTQSAAVTSGSEGAIKAIGRQLIDVQAVENIIKAGEKREKMGAGMTTARVISAARGEGIKALLTKIDACPGVVGSLIVGNDGLVIASTLTGGMDKDLLGALCTAMHSHSELAIKKLDWGKMRQIIFHTKDKVTILTAVAVGVLAVFVDNADLAQIDSLLTAIDQTVRG